MSNSGFGPTRVREVCIKMMHCEPTIFYTTTTLGRLGDPPGDPGGMPRGIRLSPEDPLGTPQGKDPRGDSLDSNSEAVGSLLLPLTLTLRPSALTLTLSPLTLTRTCDPSDPRPELNPRYPTRPSQTPPDPTKSHQTPPDPTIPDPTRPSLTTPYPTLPDPTRHNHNGPY